MASFKPAKPGAAAAQPVPNAYAGDEIFFHKAGQPVSGKVLCTGQHGCTVEHDGKPHRIKWEHVAGHKKRAVQRYKVLEQGHDGMIVEDGTGKRRYVGIPAEARQEQLALDKVKAPSS